MADKKIYEIDGENFSTLNEFFDEISNKLIPNAYWGHNLNALNDILRGGFGTPDEGFVLRWKNSQISQQRLGYAETVRVLQITLHRSHPTNRDSFARELAAAEAHSGKTVFDWLVDIIRVHCVGGREETDGVELILC